MLIQSLCIAVGDPIKHTSTRACLASLNDYSCLHPIYFRLNYLPGSYRDLEVHLRAMWLSDNQSKPLVDLQDDHNSDGMPVLVNYLLPQLAPDTEEIGQL